MPANDQKTILLVEDEAIIALAEKSSLEEYGYSVLTVNSGKKAIDIAQSVPELDLILMDIDLGRGMDGTQAAEQILESRDLPIIFLSSHTEPEIVARTEKITSYGYVVKNSTITVIDASIKMAFKLFEAKNQLRKSKNLFRLINNASFDQIYSYDLENRFTSVNKQLCDDLQRSEMEIIGKTYWDLGFPEDLCREWDEWHRQVYKEGSFSTVTSTPMPDGTTQYFEVNLSILHNESDAVIGITGVNRNITESQFTKKALEESEQTFQKLFEDSSDAILLIDATDVFVECNQAALDLLKMTREQLFCLHPGKISPELQPNGRRSAEMADEMIHLAYQKGQHRFDWTHIDSEGEEFIVEVSLMPIVIKGKRMLHTTWRDITERKIAETRLAENEHTFRKLFEDSADAILLIDGTGVFVECNQAALDLLKMTREQFLFLPPVKISPEFQPNGRRSDEAALEMIDLAYKKGHHRFDWTCVNSEGGEFIVEVSLMPIVVKGKTMLHTTWRDVTNRIKAERALAESERTFRKLFEDSADAILLIDKTGVFVECNQAALDLLKMTREQFLFLPPVKISPEFQPNGRRSDEAALEMIDLAYKKGHHRFDWTCVNSEGGEFIVEVSLMPIAVKGETMLHTTWRDITERKKIEQELETTQALLTAAMSQSPSGILLAEAPGGNITFANAAAFGIRGQTGTLLTGIEITQHAKNWKTFKMDGQTPYPPDQLPLSRAILEGVTSENVELIIRDETGKNRIVSSSASPIRDKEGKIISGIVIFHDITERKLAEKKIHRQLEEKEILLKEVHHRIKNNISSIESLLSMQRRSINHPEAVAALQDAISRVKGMRILYDKLLLSKDYQDVSIKEYIETLIDAISNVLSDGVEIAVEMQIADFNLDAKIVITIGIIINELLTNIYKYAFTGRDRGHISITLVRRKNHITLTIRDNGNGFDERIYLNKSHGFGLTIVKLLIDQLNGSFKNENDNGTRSILSFEI